MKLSNDLLWFNNSLQTAQNFGVPEPSYDHLSEGRINANRSVSSQNANPVQTQRIHLDVI